MKNQLRHVGFTLIELLVVIAVIMVLSAMLFPVVGRVQERGRSAKCVSNLRQLHTAAMSYINGSGGTLPQASSAKKWSKNEAGTWVGAGWVTGWVAAHPMTNDNMKAYWWGTNGIGCIQNGSLFQYLGENGDESVYACPTMQKVARETMNGDQANMVRSYGMNSQLSGASYQDIDGLSRIILFADQGFANVGLTECMSLIGGGRDDASPPGGAGTNAATYFQRWGRAIDGSIDSGVEYIGELHGNNRMANVIFCDGHVESVSYLNTTNVCSGNWEAGAPVQ